MIKTIFNSFGRTLGRILCYITIGILIAIFCGLINVKAAERTDNWFSNVKYLPVYVQAYNWSSATNYSSINIVPYTFGDLYPSLFNNGEKLLYPVYNSGSTVFSIAGPLGDNGRSFVFNLPNRISKQMYTAVTSYICYSGGDMPNVSRIGAGDSYTTALTTEPKYKSTNRLYLNGLQFFSGGSSMNFYCGAYFSIIQPNEQSSAFNLRMDGVSKSNIVYILMGIDVVPLANADVVTASQIESIVKNSGLATATSVNEVKASINKVQEKANEINNTISSDDVDDSNGKSFFDNFATSDNGGISSIITAPLKFIARATDTCKPIKIPFYDEEVTLPCGDTLFWNKPEVKVLRDVFNTIIGGGFLYVLVIKIYRILQNIKDPLSDSNGEVPTIKL